MKSVRLLGSLLLALSLLVVSPANGQDASHADTETALNIGQIQHEKVSELSWWTFSEMALQPSPTQGYRVVGDGRMLLRAVKDRQVALDPLVLEMDKGSTVFIDRVEGQSRIMVLSGRVAIQDPVRRMVLSTSLQLVRVPAQAPEYFIDDGIYRRPPMQQFDDESARSIIRQFYLEQVVFNDPMLRLLYAEDRSSRRWIKRLNKRGAILRSLDGTWQYEEGQV